MSWEIKNVSLYSTEERAMLYENGLTFRAVSSTWVSPTSSRYLWADPVSVGPRRWFMEYRVPNEYYSGNLRASPPFGQLEPLLLWAKLEGLL